MTIATRHHWLVLLAAAAALSGGGTEVAAADSANLADLSIEELMNEVVTSVSKKEESLFDAAAAVSVLSNDDLRRSGATTVADALRLVPGLNVGSVDASHWAISARGFNNLYANKLLVLVDGRAVYTPLFAGVYWDAQQMLLENVDRIEVIRGPGATVWGANAVNGVINIVTRSAQDTQGGLVSAGVGNPHQVMAGARYGGQIEEDTQYRLFAGYRKEDGYLLANGGDAGDAWQGLQGGFRLDHRSAPDTQLTWQGGATLSELDDGETQAYNLNTLGRWTRQREKSAYEVQAYLDRTYRDESELSRIRVDTLDLGFQHTFGDGGRNEVIWGLGYRFIGIKADEVTPLIQFRDRQLSLQLFSAFVQDEFKLVPDQLTLTAGVKLEHNDFTGIEIQPSLRAVYKPTQRQTLWSAVSRAARTPSVVEGRDAVAITFGAPFTGPDGGQYLPTLVGNDSTKSEVLWAYELGYRVRPAERISVDVATFYNRYSKLLGVGSVQRFIPGNPMGIAEIPFTNLPGGTSWGGEIVMTASPGDHWRLIASYSLLRMELDGTTEEARTIEQGSPRHQAGLRSSFDFSNAASLDTQLRYVGAIHGVPAYLEGDVRLSYRPHDRLEFSLVGQNLLDSRHPEQAPAAFTAGAEVPRGYYGKLTWRFQ